MNFYKKITLMFCLNIAAATLLAQPDNRPELATVESAGLLIDAKKSFLLERYEEAISFCEQALKKDKTNAAAYFEMAKAYEQLKEKTKAQEKAKNAYDLAPDNEWFATYYAKFLSEKGEYEAAAAVYQKIIAKAPKNATIYYETAYLLTKLKKYNEAVAIYNNLEQKEGVTELTSRQKHSLYLLLNQPKKAVEALENLIATFPDEARHYHALAQFHEQNNEKEKAKLVYQRALAANPDDAVSSIALAEGNKAAGNEAQYLLGLMPLFNKSEVDIDLKVKELYPYIEKLPNVQDGVTEALLTLAKTMTETHPDEAKAFAVYADMLYFSGKTTESLVQYNKTLALDNTVFSVWEQTLLVNMELGNTEEVIKRSEEGMDIFPNQATLYYMNGLANNQNGKFAQARDMLEQALMMSGKDANLKVDIYGALGRAYQGEGKAQQAMESFEEALKIQPKSVVALTNYSYYLARKGENLEQALKMMEQANALAPNESNVQEAYGVVFYKQKDYKNAEKWLKKALDNGGDKRPQALDDYGNTLFRLNRVEEAVQYWQQAKNFGGNAKVLEQKISTRQLVE